LGEVILEPKAVVELKILARLVFPKHAGDGQVQNTCKIFVVAIAKIIILASGPMTTSFLNRSDENRQSKKLLGLGKITLSSTAENSHR
jgi:hypothetical protein